MTGIIDIHAHILPGIDDGSRDWDESRKMLEESYRQGIRYIIATPHYSRRGLNPDIYDLSEKLREEARRIAPEMCIRDRRHPVPELCDHHVCVPVCGYVRYTGNTDWRGIQGRYAG